MKPATQVGIDADQNVLTSFPFDMKGMRRSEILNLAKTTQRCFLSLSHRVTSFSNNLSVVYKFTNYYHRYVWWCTSTWRKVWPLHRWFRVRHQWFCPSDEETKSLSIVPDSIDESDAELSDDLKAGSHIIQIFNLCQFSV